jgi:hypothetical protein
VIPFQTFNVLSDSTLKQIQKDLFELVPYYRDSYLQPIKNINSKKILSFSSLCVRIHEIFIDKNYVNPRITRIGIIKNNRPKVPFHLHPNLENMSPVLREQQGKFVKPAELSFVAVYYFHDLHESKYQGTLGVKRHAEDTNGYMFPAIPNSLIIHDCTFGHDAKVDEIHPTITRSSCYTHWTVDA